MLLLILPEDELPICFTENTLGTPTLLSALPAPAPRSV